VERVEGTQDSGERDGAKLEEMIAGLGEVEFCDIRVKPFRVTVGKVVHGLIYECVDAEDSDDPGSTHEYVLLEPNDIMFHPPWDSGEYST
jgi:formate hydrogenlyase regulatory protein HycA